jgi:hypothetical protein
VPDRFTVGDNLLARLAEIGIQHVFGVPSDYRLAFLDHVLASDQLTWVGNANELNAAYAADGYARVHGAGALVSDLIALTNPPLWLNEGPGASGAIMSPGVVRAPRRSAPR